jgi:hypothetical protein
MADVEVVHRGLSKNPPKLCDVSCYFSAINDKTESVHWTRNFLSCPGPGRGQNTVDLPLDTFFSLYCDLCDCSVSGSLTTRNKKKSFSVQLHSKN